MTVRAVCMAATARFKHGAALLRAPGAAGGRNRLGAAAGHLAQQRQRRPTRLAPAIRAERSSLDAEPAALGVEALERLYAAAAVSPADSPAAQAEAGTPASQAAFMHGEPHHSGHHPHHHEVCGRHVCVEHLFEEGAVLGAGADGGAAAEAPAPAEGPAGWLSQLLDKLPLSPRSRGVLMLNLLVLLVATNWVVVKDVGASFDPYGFAFLRFAVAAAAFSPFMKAAAKDRRIMQAGVEIGVWTAAGYIFQSAGLLTTDASRASFLSTFTVLVVPFLAGMSGKGVSPVTWASCLAALVGVGLLEQGGSPPSVGDIWSILSAVAFGMQIFRTEHWARILGNGANLSLMSVVLTTTMVFAAVVAGVAHPDAVVAMLQHPEAVAQSWFGAGDFPWREVVYCGLLTTDLALLLELLALQDVSSTEAAIIYTLEPVLGAGFAWVLLGERLGAKGFMGAAIILCSSLATQLMGQPASQEEGSSDEAAPVAAPAAAAPPLQPRRKDE